MRLYATSLQLLNHSTPPLQHAFFGGEGGLKNYCFVSKTIFFIFFLRLIRFLGPVGFFAFYDLWEKPFGWARVGIIATLGPNGLPKGRP